jgi:hypothetical protein
MYGNIIFSPYYINELENAIFIPNCAPWGFGFKELIGENPAWIGEESYQMREGKPAVYTNN